MSITDPIADLLTSLRNATRARKEIIDVPSSIFKTRILDILKQERFIRDYKIMGEKSYKTLRVYLKVTKSGGSAMTDLRRVSKPGLRVYSKKTFGSRGGRRTGITILSTSKGIMTDKDAKNQGIGGEVLCYVR